MKRFTIRRNGFIMGTYPGKDETEALDALAKEEGYGSFAISNQRQGLTRDDYKVQEVPEK